MSSADRPGAGIIGGGLDTRAMTQATISERTVLVVEDDVALRGVLLRGLREEGFAVEGAATGPGARPRSSRRRRTALDRTSGCPTRTDATSARRCARAASQTPVLFLTARDASSTGRRLRRRRGRLPREAVCVRRARRAASGAPAPQRRGRRLEAAGLRLDPLSITRRRGEKSADADGVPAAREAVRGRARQFAAATSSGPAGRTARSCATTPSTHTSRGCDASSAARAGARDRHRARRRLPIG